MYQSIVLTIPCSNWILASQLRSFFNVSNIYLDDPGMALLDEAEIEREILINSKYPQLTTLKNYLQKGALLDERKKEEVLEYYEKFIGREEVMKYLIHYYSKSKNKTKKSSICKKYKSIYFWHLPAQKKC